MRDTELAQPGRKSRRGNIGACQDSIRTIGTSNARADAKSAGNHGRKRLEYGPGGDRDSGGDDDI